MSRKLQHHSAYTFHWQSKLFHKSDLPQSTDLRRQKTRFCRDVTSYALRAFLSI